jgi:hypothetical protein
MLSNLTAILLLALSLDVYGGCLKKINLKTILSTAWECEDGSISYDQPSGTSNYEGLCGPTAAANVFHAYCQRNFIEVKDVAEKYFYDITPGVRPDSMERGLNKLFENNPECIDGEWKYYYVDNRWAFLDSLFYELRRGHGHLTRNLEDGGKAKRSPVLVLLRTNRKNLHWVTVVDIVGHQPGTKDKWAYMKPQCQVIYNESGNQASEDCASFVRKAEEVNDHWYTQLTLPPYVHLVFEKK